ncbi:cytochrome P450 [Leucobacter sp. wl10]|uniref:cytochrome P450 n=1 Tax=Leucobacter sp. wl10 TaxID=2304677 RepID=UPI001F08E56F|nr:cytochrome P450 [Leucobacter sp. wl10]
MTLDTLAAARQLLRARGVTTQAGFTAERIPRRLFEHRPILIDDGAQHDEHRRTLARFFAPAKLAQQHGDFIEQAAREAVEKARATGGCVVDELALHYSVTIASRIVGLTHAPVERLAERLTRFFRQPPVDHTASDYGRTRRDWMRAARNAIGPLIGLYLHDVRPAIRARRERRRTDIISHLIDLGYRPREILVECLTYGTAGMVTTREFISAACWRLLENDQLRERYLAAGRLERHAILAEIIRLEPPVSHLYRRVRADGQCPYPAGTLVDIDVGAANRDPEVFGDHAGRLCPGRKLPASEQTGLSFGDGAHRCPGAPLAMLEADALLTALLRADPVMRSAPSVHWETLIEGYQIRGLEIDLTAPDGRPPAS